MKFSWSPLLADQETILLFNLSLYLGSNRKLLSFLVRFPLRLLTFSALSKSQVIASLIWSWSRFVYIFVMSVCKVITLVLWLYTFCRILCACFNLSFISVS